MKARLAAVLALTSCATPGRAPAPAPRVTAPPTPTAAAATNTPPQTPSVAATDVPAWSGERVFRGSVGDARVVVRLEIDEQRVRGRYFYEQVGADLVLSGSFARGVLELGEEASGGKLTGRFEVALQRDQSLVGRWRNPTGSRTLPVQLSPVTPAWQAGTPLPVFRKHVRLVRAASAPHPLPDIKQCIDDFSYPEVVGAFEPAVEAKLNGRLRPKSVPVEADCNTGYEYQVTYAVALNRGGLFSVVYDHASCCGAHPSYSKSFVNLAVPSLNELKLLGLVQNAKLPRLRALLAPAVSAKGKQVEDLNPDEILDQLTAPGADFNLEEQGVRFSAYNSQPHAIQAAFDDGFLVPYAKLRPLLVEPSPLGGL